MVDEARVLRGYQIGQLSGTNNMREIWNVITICAPFGQKAPQEQGRLEKEGGAAENTFLQLFGRMVYILLLFYRKIIKY